MCDPALVSTAGAVRRSELRIEAGALLRRHAQPVGGAAVLGDRGFHDLGVLMEPVGKLALARLQHDVEDLVGVPVAPRAARRTQIMSTALEPN